MPKKAPMVAKTKENASNPITLLMRALACVLSWPYGSV
jgi:hypothetical protein